MKKPEYILSIDQGTTGTRAGIVNQDGKLIDSRYQEIQQFYPKPGWVEQDPIEIFESVSNTVSTLLDECNIQFSSIISVGITNQRETIIVWDKTTGKPIYNAIVWQCRRTTDYCNLLIDKGLSQTIKNTTGLTIDPYFSATKICWILDNVPGARKLAEDGSLAFGTVDSWLVWNFSNGSSHIIDITNASRTMLFDINKLEWSDELLDIMNIPKSMLPEVVPSSGELAKISFGLNNPSLPLTGIAGDQQSALFGQGCFEPGMVKVTYGTGAFLLINTGPKLISTGKELLTTIGWSLNGQVSYALEGAVFSAGSTIQWLRDQMKIINHSSEVEDLALSVEDNGGVFFVPAFSGLGSPYWDPEARATIQGITGGSNRGHIARAAIESIAYQCDDVINLMLDQSNISLKEFKADGGASVNNTLMQFQSDISDCNIQRSATSESTLLGAAYLSGIGSGFWSNIKDLASKWESGGSFSPTMPDKKRKQLKSGWSKAVERSLRWSSSGE